MRWFLAILWAPQGQGPVHVSLQHHCLTPLSQENRYFQRCAGAGLDWLPREDPTHLSPTLCAVMSVLLGRNGTCWEHLHNKSWPTPQTHRFCFPGDNLPTQHWLASYTFSKWLRTQSIYLKMLRQAFLYRVILRNRFSQVARRARYLTVQVENCRWIGLRQAPGHRPAEPRLTWHLARLEGKGDCRVPLWVLFWSDSQGTEESPPC